MIGQDDIIFSEEGDMLVHEDAIQSSALSQEELAILEASKDAARIVQGLKREVHQFSLFLYYLLRLYMVDNLCSRHFYLI